MDDVNGYAPIIDAMESWRDAGVLDAPARLDALTKSLRRLEDENRQLRGEVKVLKDMGTSQLEVAETLAAVVKSLKDIAANKSQIQLHLPNEIAGKLEVGPQNVHVNPLIRMDAPVVNMDVDALGEMVGKTIGTLMLPILKAISERPEPQAPSVDVAAPYVQVDMAPVALALEKGIGGMVAQLSQPAAQVQVTVDTEGIAEAVGKAIGKSMERFAERMQPLDLAPVLKRIEEGNVAVQKALAERNRPKQKRIGHDPNTGDLIVTEE